jgi:hypothetical protein
MVVRKKDGGLTKEEQRIVKALLNKRWRNQDIQALINSGGRKATVNSGRITGVKQDAKIEPATDAELQAYQNKKAAFDPVTKLNLFEDERLIRAREAMILAVQVFNGGIYKFKAELFAVLANIAWTYLLHEFYRRKNIKIIDKDGRSLLLGQMIDRQDCPLSDGAKRNLRSMKAIRDEVEHLLLGQSNFKWAPLFQACCLNFDAALRRLFGESLSLENDLSFALQFAKPDMEQLATLLKYDIPEKIEALDARLKEGMTDEQLADLEYAFRVVYTLDHASKGKANFEFISPGSEQGQAVQHILQKYKIADDMYPHKPNRVVRIVSARAKTNFTTHNHTQAWKLYKVRPDNGSKQPNNTSKEYCIFHPAHGDYTYSETWVDHLVQCVGAPNELAKIKAVKV